MNTSVLRLLLPETLWLEPEYYEIASQQSQLSESGGQSVYESGRESVQWQIYLSSLAQLSCQDWLQEKLPKMSISQVTSENSPVRYLDMNGFRLCVIATAHVLDEIIRIPQAAIETSQPAHFYVAIEVLEEQQEAVLRGFISYPALQASAQRVVLPTGTIIYRLSLYALDAEPNHLVSYIQQLSPSAIALPSALSPHPFTQTPAITKLSTWLDETLSTGWQAIESLLNPQMAIAMATRSRSEAVKAGKVIRLGAQSNSCTASCTASCTVVLLVSVIPDEDKKLNVQIQVLPTSDAQILPESLKLSLRSHTGVLLQEVIARSADNYIQLRSFRGKRNARFSVDIELADMKASESFEL